MVQLNTQWLSEWLSYKESLPETAHEKLVSQGLENDITNNHLSETVLVGHIVGCGVHPKSSKLQVCTVDVGQDQYLTILCGCPSARQGIKVAVATVGTRLGDFDIGVRTIQGMESYGMLCSPSELGLAHNSSGIWHLDPSAPVGECLATWLKIDTTRLDIEVTMNRGDCLSLRGIARELSMGLLCDLACPWDIESVSLSSYQHATSVQVAPNCREYSPIFHTLLFFIKIVFTS